LTTVSSRSWTRSKVVKRPPQSGQTRRRLIAAVLTAVAALAFGFVLGVSDQVPGTVPPLVAVAVWFVTRRAYARQPIPA
jgi:uncharacterized protein (TIGR04206 family)